MVVRNYVLVFVFFFTGGDTLCGLALGEGTPASKPPEGLSPISATSKEARLHGWNTWPGGCLGVSCWRALDKIMQHVLNIDIEFFVFLRASLKKKKDVDFLFIFKSSLRIGFFYFLIVLPFVVSSSHFHFYLIVHCVLLFLCIFLSTAGRSLPSFRAAGAGPLQRCAPRRPPVPPVGVDGGAHLYAQSVELAGRRGRRTGQGHP